MPENPPSEPFIFTESTELPFDRAVEQWNSINRKLGSLGYKEKFEIVSGEQMAMLRTRMAATENVSGLGCYTREGIIYFHNDSPTIVRTSPVLENASAATREHMEQREFYLTDSIIEKALLSGSYKLPSRDAFSVPTNRFGEDGLTRFYFGRFAVDYGNFLREFGKREMPVFLLRKGRTDTSKEGAFARQLWLSNIHQGGGLMAETGIDFDCRMRAIITTYDPHFIERYCGAKPSFN